MNYRTAEDEQWPQWWIACRLVYRVITIQTVLLETLTIKVLAGNGIAEKKLKFRTGGRLDFCFSWFGLCRTWLSLLDMDQPAVCLVCKTTTIEGQGSGELTDILGRCLHDVNLATNKTDSETLSFCVDCAQDLVGWNEVNEEANLCRSKLLPHFTSGWHDDAAVDRDKLPVCFVCRSTTGGGRRSGQLIDILHRCLQHLHISTNNTDSETLSFCVPCSQNLVDWEELNEEANLYRSKILAYFMSASHDHPGMDMESVEDGCSEGCSRGKG